VADPQLESLLQIKSFIDKAGVLKSWNRQAGQNRGYCKVDWVGVFCKDDNKQVVYRISVDGEIQGLRGQLPPASAFQGLPGLTNLTIADQPFLVGTLPPDWASLQKLQLLWLGDNSLTGSLPPSWGQLRQLKVLYLDDNELSGPLPDAYKALTAMKVLILSHNSLTGSLPPSWGQLRQLKALNLWGNKLSGPLPDAYKALTALDNLYLSDNSLTGSVPPSWASMTSLNFVGLWSNPKLSGCLPTSWKQQMTVAPKSLEGTALKGFC
jgi:Leucine-rich repeat (LRR) protein